MTRKLGNTVSPVVELTKNNDTFSLSSNSAFKNSSISFKFGEEFDEETVDGRKVKSVITQEGNKLVHTQKGDKVTTIVREFEPDQLKMVMGVKYFDVVSRLLLLRNRHAFVKTLFVGIRIYR